MSRFGIFRKKEKKQEPEQKAQKTEKGEPKPSKETLLEQLCGSDRELYEVLTRTMMLNPETAVKEGADSYLERAQSYEKDGARTQARIAYQTAGELSLYEGKLPQVQKSFRKAAEVDPEYSYRKIFEFFNKKENAERALNIAREFYAKTGKHVEAQKT